jgi:hypothetical protein
MAESILLGVLGKDYGDGVFKYLDPRTADQGINASNHGLMR